MKAQRALGFDQFLGHVSPKSKKSLREVVRNRAKRLIVTDIPVQYPFSYNESFYRVLNKEVRISDDSFQQCLSFVGFRRHSHVPLRRKKEVGKPEPWRWKPNTDEKDSQVQSSTPYTRR